MKINNIIYAIEHETPVYYVNEDTLDILRGIIIGLNNFNFDVEVKIQIEYNESTGKKNCYIIDTISNAVFEYKVDALEYRENQQQYKISQYCLEIKTVEDLLRFPLNHQINGNNCNGCAFKAYLQKAKELCDIKL